MKKYIKYSISLLWRILTANGLLLRSLGPRVPILCYHSVSCGHNSELSPISKETFKLHMEFISKNYNVISLSELVNLLHSGCKIDSNMIVITFDDAYLDNYTCVFPIIKKFNIPITIFVPTGYIDKEIDFFPNTHWKPMTWDHIVSMNESSLVDFGSHTHTHTHMTELDSYDSVEKELVKSKNILESYLKKKVDLFAFPNGQGKDIPKKTSMYLEKLGYIVACTTFNATRNKKENNYSLNRIVIHGDDTLLYLKSKVRGDYDYLYFLHKINSWLFHKKSKGWYQ